MFCLEYYSNDQACFLLCEWFSTGSHVLFTGMFTTVFRRDVKRRYRKFMRWILHPTPKKEFKRNQFELYYIQNRMRKPWNHNWEFSYLHFHRIMIVSLRQFLLFHSAKGRYSFVHLKTLWGGHSWVNFATLSCMWMMKINYAKNTTCLQLSQSMSTQIVYLPKACSRVIAHRSGWKQLSMAAWQRLKINFG